MLSSSRFCMAKSGHLSSVYLRRYRNSPSVRVKYETGPLYYKRKDFSKVSPRHAIVAQRDRCNPKYNDNEEKWYSDLPGDVKRRPDIDYTFNSRKDQVRYMWDKRGKLQLHQLTGKKEYFVCYNCGIPTKSHLVVIKDDNWDWRMCYRCYCKTVMDGMEDYT
jgi:hypothetical protein